ncbi:hypothetical protein BIFANG_03342 [Bifidobacterium angulatum DSM 20098 = JCM 7096]|nr:hypothetical protein BIFANG_03342 [Bifidobacterium angulatum DSM 20098 = JCM 7096]
MRVRRIIPACAGNTWPTASPPTQNRDHPRVCGEHIAVMTMTMGFAGSSPRVRGTPSVAMRSRVAAGIIPACAGNTSSVANTVRPARDHPRVCGEHGLCLAWAAAAEGSSPRVRGTP